MKEHKVAALAVLAFACVHSAGAQSPPQACKYATRMTSGQDVALVVAGDGTIWYASQNTNRIVRMDPKGGETPFVPVDGSTKGLSGMVLDGKGNVWFSKRGGGVGLVGRFPEAGACGRRPARTRGAGSTDPHRVPGPGPGARRRPRPGVRRPSRG